MARTAAKKKTVGSIFDAFRRAMSSSTSLSAKDREELEKAIGKEEDELPEALKEHEFKPSGDESVAEGANGANGTMSSFTGDGGSAVIAEPGQGGQGNTFGFSGGG